MKTKKFVLPVLISMALLVSCSDENEIELDSVTTQEEAAEPATENTEEAMEPIDGQDVFLEDYSFLADSQKSFLSAPENIPFVSEGLYPEGVEFDFRRNRFYVGSLTQGSIGIVTKEGDYEPFIEDEVLTTTTGLHIDNFRDRLYVCITSMTGEAAGVAGYDLKTGERILYVDLLGMVEGSPQFPNDLITDFYGNLYVTDSFASVVYKIDRDGEPRIFLQDERLVSSMGFGLNGITYHPFGFLLVATGDDVFFRVPVRNPESFTEIPLGIGGNVDGIQILDFNTILAVSNGEVVKLKTDDFWRSVELGGSYTVQGGGPTTLANSYFNKTYVVNAILSGLGSTPPVSDFSLELVKF